MENIFAEMTAEQAEANDLWDAITLEKNESSVTIKIKIEMALGIPDEVVDENVAHLGASKGQVVATLLRERVDIDMDELFMVAQHKINKVL